MLIPVDVQQLVHGEDYELVVCKDVGWLRDMLPIGMKETFMWDSAANYGKGKFFINYRNGYHGWHEAENFMIEVNAKPEVIREAPSGYKLEIEPRNEFLDLKRSIGDMNLDIYSMSIEDIAAAYEYCKRNGLIIDAK